MAFKSKFIIPESLSLDDKITYSIGNLISVWAGCECTFLYMFRCLIGKGEDYSAQLIWLSNKNINTKLQMVIHMCRVKNVSEPLIEKIICYAQLFKGITKTRNNFCHAYYGPDEETNAPSMEFATILQIENKDVFSYKKKPLDKQTLNELIDTINRAEQLVYEMGPALVELHSQLEVRKLEPPELPLVFE